MSSPTRTRILAEGERLFGQHGFNATRLASIAKGVGLGNAGLLHHFPSKAALYRAILEDIAADLDSRYTVADLATDPIGALEQLLAGMLALHRERPNALAIIAHEFLDQSGRIDAADVLPLAGVVKDTVAILKAGQQSGTIRGGDPVAMTAALHGALIIGCIGRAVYRRTSDDATAAEGSAEGWEAELTRSGLASVLVTS